MRKKYVLMMFLAAMTVMHYFAQDGSASTKTPATPEEKGVWAEGFAEFTEHLMKEKAGSGEYRKKVLLDYGTFVQPGNETSLREFQGGGGAASRAVGRGKAALVFDALRRTAGEEAFSRVARTLAAGVLVRSWDDIRSLFEKETGRDLGWFFTQWVDRKGLPDLLVENAAVRRNGSRFEVSFDLFQKGDVYTLDVPVVISFLRGGGRSETVKMDAGKKHASFFVDEEPSEVVIDPDYEIPRKLTEAETPPLLAKILTDEKVILVRPESGADIYIGAVEAWTRRGAEARKAGDLKEADIKASSLVVLGGDNPIISRLYGKIETESAALDLAAKKNPWNPDKVVVIVQAKSAASASASVQSIIESGECSSLSIDAQGRMLRETDESGRGMAMELRGETTAVDVSALKTLSDVTEKASDKRIVYVGEAHDRFAHHNVQLQVIKDLHRKDPRVAVGMEMFQRPFQKALDDYIGGVIDEREFLKKSEYFKRWSFDYNLYKPILDFARAEKIPVVALNVRSEIVEQVSRKGMDSLTDDQKKEIPDQLDFSDTDYRDRLRQVFEQHQGRGERNFDYFHQAQILWDETMALSVDEYLQKNPDRRMVVIAGAGHIAYGSGIPKRVLRRNGYAYVTILNDSEAERDIADYLVFPQQLEGVAAPKLMVALKEDAGKVIITALSEGGAAKKAGIKSGDALVSLDGAPVVGVDDVKLALFYKKHEETVRVKVERKRFLLGDKDLEFDVKLP